MNILVWVVQILLALWNIIGGAYTLVNYDQLKSDWASDLPPAVWIAIGGLQVFFAADLLMPLLVKKMARVVPVAATYLCLNSLAGCVIFAKYQGFPGVLWGLIPAALAAFIAMKRRAV